MALLTRKHQALLNDMLQREHIGMFIGLKLDMETILNAKCMKTTMTPAKSHSPDAFFFLSFKQLHSAASLCCPCIDRNRQIYALAKVPPTPRDGKDGNLYAIFGFGCGF